MTILVACLLSPGFLWAGAWPREKGTAFVATSFNDSKQADGSADGYQSLYAEYGMTPKLTFGAKLWRRADGRHGDAVLFATYPIGDPDSDHRFAIGLGVGVRHYDNGHTRAILMPEAHWGKGFDTPLGHGWFTLSAYLGHAFGTDDTWAKADLTLGLKADDSSHVIVQLRTFEERTGDVAVLAPSYVREIRKGLHIEAGATYRMKGGNRWGLLVGSWVEF